MPDIDNQPWLIRSPLDMHLHLRQGEMTRVITSSSSDLFAGAVIMPNLVPPVTDIERVRQYRREIDDAAGASSSFRPYMTLFFRDYRREILEEVREDIIGIKLYPEGVTTNSAGGVREISSYGATLEAMQELGIPLLIHGETHGFVLDREREFLPTYEKLARDYPRMTIVMEHITTAAAIALLDRYDNLHATVTLHHLLLTLDDMAGGLLRPHLFCKPILKRPEDRKALQQAVIEGNPKIMFGSDSAPHPVDKKECCGCAAGVFSAPVALAMLAEFFDRNGRRGQMQKFVSDHACAIYRISPPEKRVTLTNTPWVVPERIGPVVPFMAGETLPWQATLAP